MRKEQEKDRKKASSKAEKQPAAAKKRDRARALRSAKAKPVTVEIMASTQHVMETLSNMQLGICIFDKEDRIIAVSRHFSGITGLQTERITGKKLAKNALWGEGEEQEQFAELFAEARSSGKPVAGERWAAGAGEEGNKYWNITLLPQQEDNKEYCGMYLTIQEICEKGPEVSMAELIGGILKEGLRHDELRGLLDNLVGIVRDFCRCSQVKIALMDRSEEHVVRAETGKELGLWDTGETLTPDVIKKLFEQTGEEASQHRNDRGTIYLENINLLEGSLEGEVKELAVNLRNSYGFRSIAFIPVKVDGRTKGFIQLANTRAGGITSEALEAVEIAADQLHMILERTELKEDVRRQRESLLRQMHERSAHLEAMSGRLKQEVFERKKSQDEMREQRDLAVTLNGIVNLNEALQLCLESAIRVAGADSGGIYLVDRQTGGLVLSCSKGLSDEFIATVSQYEQSSPNYELVMKMNPVYATMKDLEPSIGDRYKIEGLKGVALIPLVHDNKVVGCLNIASHEQDEIPAGTRNALETVAAQVGSTLARIQGRKELEDTEECYRALFEKSIDPILVTDTDGKYMDGNDAALAFMECTREELLAMNVKDTLPPYLDEQWLQQYRELWERGGIVERDYYVWGKIKVMEMTVASVQLGEQRIVIGIGKDITERKKAEAALQKSEEKYRMHINSVSDVIFSFDPEINIMDVSPSVERLLGYRPEELIGRPFAEINIAVPEVIPEALEKIKRVMGGEQVENARYIALAKDGTRKCLEINAAPMYNGDKIIGVVSVARDVTDRERAQEALRKSEEQYRMLADNMMDMAYMMDMNFNILWITPSAEKISGYTAEEIKTLPLSKRVTQASIEKATQMLLPVVREAKEGKGEPGRIYTMELEAYRKDGSTFWTEVRILFIRDENGCANTIFALGRDVTEHKSIGQALVESESRYRSLVESAGAGVATVNMNGEIVFVNDGYCRIIGYAKDELEGRTFADLIYPEDRDRILDMFINAVKEGTATHRLEFRAVHKDGYEVWLHTNPTVMMVNDEVVGFSAILHDITELKKAEEALRLSEEKFRDLADLLPQVIFEADREAVYTYVNKRGYEVFGYGTGEMVGKLRASDVIVPEERETAMKNYLGILGGVRSTGNEYTALRKDGVTFKVLVFSSAIIKDGEVVGLRGTYTDISGVKETERALRESEEKYRSLVENAGEAIFIAQDDKVVFANQRTFEIVHYERDEFFAKPFVEMIYPDDREMVYERYNRRLKGEQIVPVYDMRIIDKDQSVIWVELRATKIDWEGRPATLNFVTDITVRKQAEQDLKESEERYRLLADNSLDVIWTADMQGHITYVSPSIRYVVGRSAENIMNMYRSGTLTAEIFGVTEEESQRFLNGLQTLIKDATRTLSFEFGLKHEDGFTTWVEVKMSIMRDHNRQAAGILGIARDITQQKKMTERLISTDRLASLGEMAAGLAHEVNNPLTAVMGFAYLLQQNPSVPPEISKDVEAIYHEGKRAADVIKSFLVFARGQKPERQAVYINDILDGVLRLRRSQMTKENIEVNEELAEDLPAVQGEVSQLQQAFLNIILNAEYFMYRSNRGGHLTLSSLLQDNKIIVKIVDDGPGIDPEKLSRVFDPFYTTKDVGEGTGLGLSICHGIIKGHGGEIYVESGPDKGAVFTVELPVG